MSHNEFPWVDAYELCALMHISRKTLQRWEKSGVIGCSMIGRKKYYSKAEISKILEHHHQKQR